MQRRLGASVDAEPEPLHEATYEDCELFWQSLIVVNHV